ncbi:hypothetical protein [uncultured Citrobacter sp.]|uniref:hypothetical protein n=1 Tax=uncultured Citrobacter sp. TaxID=200446 RepID=UPI00266B7592|nr:hypothetical protein [uncultured Citrobacter sp.]
MNRTDAPAKQAKPFGINGQREPLLPTTPAGDNTASYDQGFPPITMILKSAGGLPPKGQDMNQILYELSALARWASSGALNTYDGSFSTAIGGYPSGALVISDDGNVIYVNTQDSNNTNPNSGGTGWKDIKKYLGLDVVVNGGAQVWLTSSSGKYHIFIGEDGSWGMWDEENSQNVPLSIVGGGTGSSDVSGAQLNLGLGCGLPTIGVPFFWPSSSMPNTVIPEWSGMTFLKLNGSSFSATQYPKLALVWPSLTLSDCRGEFIRTWDDGRGVDTGRSLLSYQGDAMRNLTGNVEGRTAGSIGRIFSSNANGVFSTTGSGGDFITPTSTSTAPSDRLSNLNIDASLQVPTANEFRPRNIAFNFLVRAK